MTISIKVKEMINMLDLKTKLETLEKLENIAKSDRLLATEKFCIFSTVLPKEIEIKTTIFIEGMLKMAEIMSTENK